jgi:elongation factor 1-gamma
VQDGFKINTFSQNNPRSTAIRAVAKANDLELDIVEVDTTKPNPEYLKLNKLGKVPTFEGADGFVLYECVAIAIYSKSSHQTPLATSSRLLSTAQ